MKQIMKLAFFGTRTYHKTGCFLVFLVVVCAIVLFMGGGTSYSQTSSPKSLATQDNANKVDLLAYVKEHNLIFNWDGNYNVGFIRKDNIIVSFQPGLPVFLINFTAQRFVEPIVRDKGRLLASPSFISLLDEIYFSGDFALPSDTGVAQNRSGESNIASSADTPTKQDQDEATASTSPPPQSNFSRVVTLVIDPGHGGKTPGAVGRFTYNNKSYRLMEKDVVLEVSLKVRDALKKKYPQLNVVMTRSKDNYISLEDRTVVANKYLDKLKEGEAMVFVSIHANAALTPSASGYEVWYLPPEYRRNNLVSEEFSHSSIYSIINNLREEEITLESVQLAEMVIRGLDVEIGDMSKKRGVKEEKFYVVRNTKMPAILIELGFVTNPKEGYNLTRSSYKEKLSKGIVDGLSEYLELFDGE